MGLDQYLSVRKYVSRSDDIFDAVVSASDVGGIMEEDGYTGVFLEVPVMYWRKFNALHNHIVQVWGNGRDECQPIELPVDGLQTIVETLNTVLSNKSSAKELFPTTSGVFFGGTDYDEYYFEQVKRTRNELRDFLKKLDERTDDLYPVYQASW